MSSIIGRAAFRATRPLRASGVNPGYPDRLTEKLVHRDEVSKNVLRKGAQKDPELYVLYVVTAATLAGTGYWFVAFVTSLFRDQFDVPKVDNSEPWKEHGARHGKYIFHPDADPKKPPREAPSAMHSVIVPKLNLPKRLHDEFNKLGKPEWDV